MLTAEQEHEQRILSGAALFEAMGGFHVIGWDAGKREATAAFTVRREFCHSHATTAQGGFVTAWLDAVMAHAVIHASDFEQTVASLEIKVSFLERVAPGPGRAVGRIVRRGSRVAFLEAELITPDGKIAARATSTGLLVPYAR
jgi:acyl-CoA thioesterase